MATTRSPGDGLTEYCEACEASTIHSVSIQLVTESGDGGTTAKYSNEPYRVAECQRCGDRSAQRMNNA